MEVNKVICGDCLEEMKKLEDNSVDLILTDPPYNLKKEFDNDDLSDEDFINFLTPIFNELCRIIKPKHSVLVFFDKGKKFPLFWKCLFNSNLKFQNTLFMYKPNDVSMPHNRVLRKSEALLICSKTEELHHDGDIYIHDVITQNHNKKEKSWSHPSVKFIEVIRKLVSSHSKENDIVLDCFMGSGTTAVACKQLNRRFIGYEISSEYCKIINKRLQQQTL